MEKYGGWISNGTVPNMSHRAIPFETLVGVSLVGRSVEKYVGGGCPSKNMRGGGLHENALSGLKLNY